VAAPRPPGSRAARWLPLLPPALLALLALHQIALAERFALNPWKGGGFGMFATSDRGGLRQVRAWRLTPEGERRASIPPELEALRLRTRDLPSPAHLEALARALAGLESPPPLALRVEVSRVRLDLARGVPVREVLRESVWRSARGG
jgi:hypothetical protein